MSPLTHTEPEPKPETKPTPTAKPELKPEPTTEQTNVPAGGDAVHTNVPAGGDALQTNDDLSNAMTAETFAQVNVALYTPLRGALRKALDDKITGFDLDKFVLDVAKDNNCNVADISRFMIYEATADMSFRPTVAADDQAPATPNQQAALRRFRLDPANYPTKAEASEMLDMLIARAQKRHKKN